MAAGLTVIDAPEPINVPPQEPVYQFWVPMVPFAVRVVLCPAQREAALAVMLVGEVTPPAQLVDR